VGAPDTGYIAWQYIGAGTQGRLTFGLPERGRYELRLYRDDAFLEAARVSLPVR